MTTTGTGVAASPFAYEGTTTDGNFFGTGITQTLTMYYKVGADSELPEWHGNLYLETEGLTADSDIKLGFLVGGEIDDVYGWDGIDCSVNFTPSDLEGATFSGVDIYHRSENVPNYFYDSAALYYGKLTNTSYVDAS